MLDRIGHPLLLVGDGVDPVLAADQTRIEMLRGLALVQCSYIEENLGDIIETYFEFNSSLRDDHRSWLIDPLTWSVRLGIVERIAKTLGLLDDQNRNTLKDVGRVLTKRNRYAHGTITVAPSQEAQRAYDEYMKTLGSLSDQIIGLAEKHKVGDWTTDPERDRLIGLLRSSYAGQLVTRSRHSGTRITEITDNELLGDVQQAQWVNVALYAFSLDVTFIARHSESRRDTNK